jgi:hypothetical protein
MPLTVTTKPVPKYFYAALIAAAIVVPMVILRVAFGSYPPLWVCLAFGGAAVVGCAVGRWAALRTVRR